MNRYHLKHCLQKEAAKRIRKKGRRPSKQSKASAGSGASGSNAEETTEVSCWQDVLFHYWFY